MTTIEDTISRIQTYTISNWDFRYQKVSPYVCAQHGFANCGENEIECTICGVKIKLEDPYKDQEYDPTKGRTTDDVSPLAQGYIDNILRKLKTDHITDCLFGGLDEVPEIGRDYLFLQGKNLYLDTLLTYTKIENIELPTLNPSFLTTMGEKNLSALFGKLTPETPLIAKASEILSIFGWKYDNLIEEDRVLRDEEHLGPKLCCSFCGRKVYVNFYPLNRDENIHYDQNYAKDATCTFDPLEEHKYFCVWGGIKDTKSNEQLGWEICLELLIYDKFRGKDSKKSDNLSLEGHQENSQEQAHLDLVLEQTQFKQEVLNRINDLREFKEKGKKRCEQVLENLGKIKIKNEKTEQFEQKINQYKVSLEDMIKELNLKVDLVKKVKPNQIIEKEPDESL